MEIDYEFLKNVVLVIIPTLIGVFSSKFIINSWQIRKEKFNIKKEILKEFDLTIPKARHNMQKFAWNLIDFTEQDLKNTHQKKYSVESIEHQKKSKKDIEKNYQHFLEIQKEIFDAISNFKSSLLLYFTNNDELQKLFEQLITEMDSTIFALDQMYQIDDTIVFNKNEKEFWNLISKSQENYQSFRKVIIRSKLSEPII